MGKWGLCEGITVPKPAGQYCLNDTEFAHLKDMYAALNSVNNIDSDRMLRMGSRYTHIHLANASKTTV